MYWGNRSDSDLGTEKVMRNGQTCALVSYPSKCIVDVQVPQYNTNNSTKKTPNRAILQMRPEAMLQSQATYTAECNVMAPVREYIHVDWKGPSERWMEREREKEHTVDVSFFICIHTTHVFESSIFLFAQFQPCST